MSADMTIDIIAQQKYGKLALERLAPVSENFRLYHVEWTGDHHDVLKVVGAEFRITKSGPNKGKLSTLIKNTRRAAYLTSKELKELWQEEN